MTHPLANQLRFSRREFMRGLEGLTAEDAARRLLPMNCIAWNVGHLAWQEQRYWLYMAQEQVPVPRLNEEFRYGAAATTPDLDEILAAWRSVTEACDPWLDAVTTATLESTAVVRGKQTEYTFGSLLLRMIYHYWYHCGENQAIRQALGHSGLQDFVGDIDTEAPYTPETL